MQPPVCGKRLGDCAQRSGGHLREGETADGIRRRFRKDMRGTVGVPFGLWRIFLLPQHVGLAAQRFGQGCTEKYHAALEPAPAVLDNPCRGVRACHPLAEADLHGEGLRHGSGGHHTEYVCRGCRVEQGGMVYAVLYPLHPQYAVADVGEAEGTESCGMVRGCGCGDALCAKGAARRDVDGRFVAAHTSGGRVLLVYAHRADRLCLRRV